MTIALGLALLLLAVVALFWALGLRRGTGLPWAPVLYRDTARHRVDQPLYSRRYGLAGKPDYLIAVRGRVVPVEVKPGRIARVPYQSDLMQLAAYCLLLEELHGSAPPYGLLRYADRTFRLDYTPHVREQVLHIVDEMRARLDAADCARSHNEVRCCRACGFFAVCDEALQ